MKKIIHKMVLFVYGIMRAILPVRPDVWIFGSNVGRNYSGNPRYIYEELVRRGEDRKHTFVWVFDHPEEFRSQVPGRVKIVKSNRFLNFYYITVAGTWVFDTRQNRHFVRRPGMRYLMTWHGTPLKKLALDMDSVSMSGNTDITSYKENFRHDSSRWTSLISQNPFSSEIFRRAFAFSGRMFETGYPRNDVLFSENTPERIRALRKQLGLPEGKKVALYAPTWRDNQFNSNGKYKFASAMDFGRLQKELGDEWVLIVKYHYLVADQVDWSPYKGFCYAFDSSYDIARLYLAADLLITDYSSVMFDFSILKRPMLFFAYDLEDYRDSLRGFYFDFLAEAPGPVCTTNDELLAAWKNWNSSEWQEKYDAFRAKYNPWDDGHASEKIADALLAKRKGGTRP